MGKLTLPSRRFIVNKSHPLSKFLIHDFVAYQYGALNVRDNAKNLPGQLLGTTKPAWKRTQYGTGLLFDGASSYLDFTGDENWDPGVGDGISMEAWVLTPASPDGQIIAKPRATGSHTSPYFTGALMAISGGARFWVSVGAGSNTTNSASAPLSANTLYHILGTYNRNTLKLYLNGVQKDSVSETGAVVWWDTPIRLGANGQPGEFWNGYTFISRAWSIGLPPSAAPYLFQNPFGIYRKSSLVISKAPVGTSSVKSILDLAKASVKNKNGLAVASVKSYNGLQ